MRKVGFVLLIGLIFGMVSCDKEGNEETTFYTVTFDADGGSPTPSTQRVEAGKTVSKPSDNPVKKGHIFMFWHPDGATTAYDFDTPVTKDITLRAKWEASVDDFKLHKAAYCLAYVYQVTEKKKQGQNISSISDVCYVHYNPNGTLDYINFSSRSAVVPYSRNIPLTIGATSCSSDVFAARWTLLDGTYDYANDPASIVAYLGNYMGQLFFSISELEGHSLL